MTLRLKTTFFVIFALFLFFSHGAKAGFSLIRDAQTEKFLRDLCHPVLIAAGLNPDQVSIYIVNDSSINAFVSGGKNIFINTGLIRKYQDPDALIGVVAHEAGHISAGHVARSSEEIERANSTMLLSYLLGIGAFIAGSPEAGQGIMLGGTNVAEKFYLKFSRSQEEAADRHALEYLNKIQYPATGLITLLEFFQSQYRGYQGQVNEYAMSHPISAKRISYLKHNIGRKFSDRTINTKLMSEMQWILLKLEGFIDNPDKILRKYRHSSTVFDKYIRSIAFYRKGEVKTALNLINQVILSRQNDGFLHELKGQFLYESGDVNGAILSYKKAINLLSGQDSSQAKIYFASAIASLKSNDSELVNLAIKNLKGALIFEKSNPFLYKTLAVSYDKINDKGRSFAALAEYNFLIGKNKKSLKYIKTAKKELSKYQKSSKIDILRLDDLKELIQNEERQKKS